MHQVFLGIGGNIGNKQDNFDKVYTSIKNELGAISKKSSVYETPPWGFESDDKFWNQILLVETPFSAEVVLRKIAGIESEIGRKREKAGYSSREIDIDILFFDNMVIKTVNLVIPHPRLHKRLFVLVPLAEIAPQFVHPVLKLTSIEMLNVCDDKSVIRKISE